MHLIIWTTLVLQPNAEPCLSVTACFSIRHFSGFVIDGGVNLKVRGLTGTWGAVGIEMSKFEAKKGDFAKLWNKLGGYSPPAPPAPPSMFV